MNKCPICKDKRTEKELEYYRHPTIYTAVVKVENRYEPYHVCDKCKAAWWIEPIKREFDLL